MSSALAELYKDGKRLGWTVHNGTSDILCPNLAQSIKSALDYEHNKHQRKDGKNAWSVLADCDHQLEQGYIYSHYGSEECWPVEYCHICAVIHGPLEAPYWAKKSKSPWKMEHEADNE